MAAPVTSTTGSSGGPATSSTIPPTSTPTTAPVATTTTTRPTAAAVDLAVRPDELGGWLLRGDGAVVALGAASVHGDAVGKFDAPAVEIVATRSGRGYWIVSVAGEIRAVGDAVHAGDLSNVTVAEPIIGLVADPDGRGYWLSAADGGVFAFDAPFLGSAGETATGPVAAVAAPVAAPGQFLFENGYYQAETDGKVWNYGPDATHYGDMSKAPWPPMVVDMATTPAGYVLLAGDGRIYYFGDAHYWGNTVKPPSVWVSIVTAQAGGYWIAHADGTVYAYGNAFTFAGTKEEPKA